MDLDKVNMVVNWKVPKNCNLLRGFIGLARYLADDIYHQELDAIWSGVLSFDSELISSKLKGNHAQNLLDIINPKAGCLPLSPVPQC